MANEIQQAFLDGLNEVFVLLFTTEVEMYLLNTTETNTNIYREVARDAKVYLDPIKVAAKVETSSTEEADHDSPPVRRVKITIPTKQLILHEIPRKTQQELDELRKVKFKYAGMEFMVDNVIPRTLVADEFHVYIFDCHENVRKSVS